MFTDVNWFTQLILPLLFGGIANVVYTYNKQKKVRMVDFITGALAGIAAVNALNPEGNFANVTTISIFAGFNGGLWLNQNSFSKNPQDTVDKDIDEIEEQIDNVFEGVNVEHSLQQLQKKPSKKVKKAIKAKKKKK